jgi:hypothetical protein
MFGMSIRRISIDAARSSNATLLHPVMAISAGSFCALSSFVRIAHLPGYRSTFPGCSRCGRLETERYPKEAAIARRFFRTIQRSFSVDQIALYPSTSNTFDSVAAWRIRFSGSYSTL